MNLKILRLILILFIFLACNNQTNTVENKTEEHSTNKESKIKQVMQGWKQLEKEDPSFILSMPYATEDNFLKEKIYPCAKCFLREDAANALLRAQKIAQSKGYCIILHDCYRPLPMQQKMFDLIPDTKYVADPNRGSRHNKGVAVDISLADENEIPLNMGTEFDDFTEKAKFDSDEISEEATNNRRILRVIMMTNGFDPYENEWWHFNYKNTNYPNELFVWDCD